MRGPLPNPQIPVAERRPMPKASNAFGHASHGSRAAVPAPFDASASPKAPPFESAAQAVAPPESAVPFGASPDCRAPVNQIIPFSAVDGPGNRTAVFLQGCNFNCQYCHNPETLRLCNHCGLCVPQCPTGALDFTTGDGAGDFIGQNETAPSAVNASAPFGASAQAPPRRVRYHPERCVRCDACIRACPRDSSPRVSWMRPQEVFQEIRKQIPYIRGVTLSGGECSLYPDFLLALFTLCKADGLDCFLDSNGSIDFSEHPALLAKTDGVMLDIKAFDPAEHRRITGTDNETVLKNAGYLAARGLLYEVRTVVVSPLLSAEETVSQTAKLLSPFLDRFDIRYKLIRYRPMGVRKAYEGLISPSPETLLHLAALAKKEGFQTVECRM